MIRFTDVPSDHILDVFDFVQVSKYKCSVYNSSNIIPLNNSNKTTGIVRSSDFSVDVTQKCFEPTPMQPAAKPVATTPLLA